MYLRTPKRYKSRTNGRLVNSWRWLPLWLLAPLVIYLGLYVYNNRDDYREPVGQLLGDIASDAQQGIENINAPQPTPTRDPSNDLRRAHESWERGAIQEAVSIYGSSSTATPNDILIHYRLTLGLIMEARYEEAVAAAENAITAQPYSADAWAIHSMALNRIGEDRAAVASALRALELVPEDRVEAEPQKAVSRARALAFLAEAYHNLGQTERAETLVNEAIELNPNSFEAYQVRGRINDETFFFDEGLADFQMAYDLAPNIIYTAIWLARVESVRNQNYDVAIELYQDIVEDNPGNTQALYDLGNYYLRVEGNASESANYLSRCIESNPDNANCHWLLGRAQLGLGETVSALESFQTAYNLEPQDGYYNYWLGEGYISLGQCPQAMPYLQAGYQIAQDTDDDDLASAFEFSLAECGSPIVQPTQPVPETEDGETETTEGDEDTPDV
jgi:tetratricopeptide (TPR) repeat protein